MKSHSRVYWRERERERGRRNDNVVRARVVWSGGRTGRPLELKSRDALNSLQRCLVPDLRQRLGAVEGRSISAGISLALRLSTLISHLSLFQTLTLCFRLSVSLSPLLLSKIFWIFFITLKHYTIYTFSLFIFVSLSSIFTFSHLKSWFFFFE